MSTKISEISKMSFKSSGMNRGTVNKNWSWRPPSGGSLDTRDAMVHGGAKSAGNAMAVANGARPRDLNVEEWL